MCEAAQASKAPRMPKLYCKAPCPLCRMSSEKRVKKKRTKTLRSEEGSKPLTGSLIGRSDSLDDFEEIADIQEGTPCGHDALSDDVSSDFNMDAEGHVATVPSPFPSRSDCGGPSATGQMQHSDPFGHQIFASADATQPPKDVASAPLMEAALRLCAPTDCERCRDSVDGCWSSVTDGAPQAGPEETCRFESAKAHWGQVFPKLDLCGLVVLAELPPKVSHVFFFVGSGSSFFVLFCQSGSMSCGPVVSWSSGPLVLWSNCYMKPP